MSNDFWPGFIATLLALIFVTLFVMNGAVISIEKTLRRIEEETLRRIEEETLRRIEEEKRK